MAGKSRTGSHRKFKFGLFSDGTYNQQGSFHVNSQDQQNRKFRQKTHNNWEACCLQTVTVLFISSARHQKLSKLKVGGQSHEITTPCGTNVHVAVT